MSIQGSFNSMLSSLVFATGQMRQARAQERMASAKEAELEQGAARLKYKQEKFESDKAQADAELQLERDKFEAEKKAGEIKNAKDEAQTKKWAAEASLTRAKASKMRYNTRKAKKADQQIEAGQQQKSEAIAASQGAYSGRSEEVANSRDAVPNLEKAMKGEIDNG